MYDTIWVYAIRISASTIFQAVNFYHLQSLAVSETMSNVFVSLLSFRFLAALCVSRRDTQFMQ